MTKFVPNGERILVKRVKENKEKTVNGIIIPDSAKKDQEVYEMIEGYTDDKRYTIGDKLILHPYNKISINLDGEEYFVIEPKDVLGWIEDFT